MTDEASFRLDYPAGFAMFEATPNGVGRTARGLSNEVVGGPQMPVPADAAGAVDSSTDSLVNMGANRPEINLPEGDTWRPIGALAKALEERARVRREGGA